MYIFKVRKNKFSVKLGEFSFEVNGSRIVLRWRDCDPGILSFFVFCFSEFSGLLTDSQRFVDCIFNQGADIRSRVAENRKSYTLMIFLPNL